MSSTNALSTAVIATGGKQYLVSVGSVLTIEKIDQAAGSKVVFDQVVMAADAKNDFVKTADLTSVKVQAEVLEEGRGKKIRVSTFKSKKRQSRTLGHRQSFTKVKITGITA